MPHTQQEITERILRHRSLRATSRGAISVKSVRTVPLAQAGTRVSLITESSCAAFPDRSWVYALYVAVQSIDKLDVMLKQRRLEYYQSRNTLRYLPLP
jgi:hypothetical protein